MNEKISYAKSLLLYVPTLGWNSLQIVFTFFLYLIKFFDLKIIWEIILNSKCLYLTWTLDVLAAFFFRYSYELESEIFTWAHGKPVKLFNRELWDVHNYCSISECSSGQIEHLHVACTTILHVIHVQKKFIQIGFQFDSRISCVLSENGITLNTRSAH